MVAQVRTPQFIEVAIAGSIDEQLRHVRMLQTCQATANAGHLEFHLLVPTGIGHSERNRPQSLEAQPLTASQKIGQAMTDKAVGSGKVTATEVAQKVFDAIASGQFYIYSHPQALGSVQVRLEDVVQGRNPTDPYAHKPELGESLKAALRAG